jgi:N-sulfoglucosamine sulfohydrolase
MLLSAIGLISPIGQGAAARPNVVLITVDDMNWDSVGAYGCYLPGVTPNMDQFATESVAFDQAHVAIAICMPCRASMMTGRYPHSSGALGFDEIKPGIETLPEKLREAGYHNTLVGKDIHTIPSRHDDAFDRIRPSAPHTLRGRGPQQFYTETTLAISAARDVKKPLYLNINVTDPHRPFAGSKGEINNIANNKEWAGIATIDDPYTADEINVPLFLADLPPVRKEIAQYYTSVRRGDQSVGNILRAIDDAGIREDTLVIFMSDHGIAVPFAKTNCYYHSTKTPLMIRWPGHTEAGRRIDDRMVSTIDFGPTILEACGLAPLKDADGESFLPLLENKPVDGRGWGRDSVFTSMNYPNNRIPFPMRSIIESGGMSYIWNGWGGGDTKFRNESQSGLTFAAMRKAGETDTAIAARVKLFVNRVPDELYNYANDPDALNNLAGDPDYRDDLNRLQRVLLRRMIATNDPQLEAYDEHLSKLRAP